MFQNYENWPDKISDQEHEYLSEYAIGYLVNRCDIDTAKKWILFLINSKKTIEHIQYDKNLYETLLECIYKIRNNSKGSMVVTDIFVKSNNLNFTNAPTVNKNNNNLSIKEFLGAKIHTIDNNSLLLNTNQIILLCRSKVPVISYKDMIFTVSFNEKVV